MSYSFSSSTLAAQNPKVLMQLVVDEYVLINPAQPNKPLFLNGIAARIWALLDGQKTLFDISSIIAAEFYVSAEEVIEDIFILMNRFEQHGVLELPY